MRGDSLVRSLWSVRGSRANAGGASRGAGVPEMGKRPQPPRGMRATGRVEARRVRSIAIVRTVMGVGGGRGGNVYLDPRSPGLSRRRTVVGARAANPVRVVDGDLRGDRWQRHIGDERRGWLREKKRVRWVGWMPGRELRGGVGGCVGRELCRDTSGLLESERVLQGER